MALNRRDIEFSTVDGTTLRGWFYSPGGSGGKRPCIIMANGITGVKEQVLPGFAERFQAANYGVLVYDYRNWGSSDGLPREETNPIQQSRDLSDAFDFALTLNEVDASKVVYWGTSMGGGVVLHAAALDKRICAVISQVPFISGEALVPLAAPFLNVLYGNRQEVKAGKTPGLKKMFADTPEAALEGDPEAMLHDPNVHDFILALKKSNKPWSPYVTTQSLLDMVAFEPLAFIHRIAPTPLLLIAADNDSCCNTSSQLKAYSQALEPKTLSILKGCGHFDACLGPGFEKNIKAQLNFLATTL
ncbi:hypothetical protein VTL71DRAFT_3052 [Oculimacula yallundae]|uniref:Serine aminopeptidase S33 domain-containing protein n=1 Tax=Oculimacula yallundae TaxID=86028 RepID=A0ABR4C6X4_9HELO